MQRITSWRRRTMQPQAGTYPTSFWDAGEVVIDDRVIEIPADALAGKYPDQDRFISARRRHAVDDRWRSGGE